MFAQNPKTFAPPLTPQKESTSSALVPLNMKEPDPLPKTFVSLPNLSLDTLLSSESFTKKIHLSPKGQPQPPISDFLEGLILPPLQPLQLSFQPNSVPSLQPEPRSSSLQPTQKLPIPEVVLVPIQEQTPIISSKFEGSSLKTAPSIPLPNLPQFLSLAELDTVNLSDCFNVELSFLAKQEGSGYLFALTLVPRADLTLPKIQQRITFLIDRANSIQKERFIASKQAVLRALDELDEEDSFNIIVFDSKMEKLFPTFSKVNASSISKAEVFLDKIGLGSFFATSDPYKPLLLTIPREVQEDEIYTAVLVTDGETLSNKSVHDTLMNDWTMQNQGKVSLYVVGMETDTNGKALETLCTLNRGRLIQSTSGRGIKRQILKLTKNIKTPLAKDLSSKVVCRGEGRPIELYPQPALAPHLYLNQPYVILGSTDTLDDFMVFIQGRLKDQWLNLRKTISFVNAKKGNASLKTAFHLYEKLGHDSIQ